MIARDIMSTDIVAIGPGHSVMHAAQIMLEKKVSGLPIVGDDGKLIGLITEGDLMRRSEIGDAFLGGANAQKQKPLDDPSGFVRSNSWCVRDVMSSNVVSIAPDCPIEDIAALLEQHDIKRLPVTQDQKLIGIVSRADLLRAIVFAPKEQVIIGDSAIRIAIMARIAFDAGLEEFEIQATVTGGDVILSGIVRTQAQRKAARVAAESVRGCRSVTNEIEVSETATEIGDDT